MVENRTNQGTRPAKIELGVNGGAGGEREADQAEDEEAVTLTSVMAKCCGDTARRWRTLVETGRRRSMHSQRWG